MTTVKIIESFVIIGVKCYFFHSFISQIVHIFKDVEKVLKLLEVRAVLIRILKILFWFQFKRKILEELHATFGIFDALAVLQDWMCSTKILNPALCHMIS